MSNPPAAVELSDGNRIPQLGLGVWLANPDETRLAVREALAAGYRHVDTAAIYRNEAAVGAGIRDAGVPREDVFVTTKIWNDAHGAAASREAALQSLDLLGLDYVDLLLIHWPIPARDLYLETWETLIRLRDEGLARSIGVSNFTDATLRRLIEQSGVAPVLNQVELHPYLQQHAMRACHRELGVATESWSPLAQNRALADPVITEIAARHQKTPAQVIIRWHIDNGCIVIPKSVRPDRIRENLDVFDFTLEPTDHAAIALLDRGERIGPDPDVFA